MTPGEAEILRDLIDVLKLVVVGLGMFSVLVLICTGAIFMVMRELAGMRLSTAGVSGVPEHALCLFKDGDAWCCVRGDFINLQESRAGFGQCIRDAIWALQAAEGERWAQVEMGLKPGGKHQQVRASNTKLTSSPGAAGGSP